VHRRLIAAALILVLLAVGSQAALAKDADVTISDSKGFDPALVTIDAGDTVFWTVDSKALVGHSVTADAGSGEAFDSSPMCDTTPANDNCLKPGDVFEHTFTTPGTFPYHDRANPKNKGEVIVLMVATTTTPPPSTTSTTQRATTTAPSTTSSTTTSSSTTSSSSTTTTTLVPATTSVSSDLTVKGGGGGGSNTPLLLGAAAVVVAGLAGAAWWAYNRGPGGPPTGPGYDAGPLPYDEPPPTTMGPTI
jgi:plastocyanin